MNDILKKRHLRFGGKIWRSPSVKKLIVEHGRLDPPEKIIKERAEATIQNALSCGWTGPPFAPLKLASILGIKTNPSPQGFAHEAMIVALPDGQLEIRFHPNRTRGRKNYSVCHEISHTFFPDSYEIIQLRSKHKVPTNVDVEVETLCEIGASYLLMPDPFFTQHLKYIGLSYKGIATLRHIYETSWEAIISRVVRTADEAIMAIFFELKNKPSEIRQLQINFGRSNQLPEKKPRVQYSISSPLMEIFIPKDKSAPAASCVYEAMSKGNVFESLEHWAMNGIGRCHVEAFPVPPKDFKEGIPRVVALVRPISNQSV